MPAAASELTIFVNWSVYAVTAAALLLIYRPDRGGNDTFVAMSGPSDGAGPGDGAAPNVVGAASQDAGLLTDSSIRRLAVTHIGNAKDGAEFATPLFDARQPREQDDPEQQRQERE